MSTIENDQTVVNQTPHIATYSPEDDKIRLYFAFRIDKEQWNMLKKAGFAWCMKQAENGGPDMAAPWSVQREDLALELAPEIEDEDQPVAERAAQRAERFAGYFEKRAEEAMGLADKFESGPTVFGHQDVSRAERQAKRHDRVGGRAVTQWDKAEYWKSRTQSVIANALYKDRADVRHRRIKALKADLNRVKAEYIPSKILHGVDHVRRYCGEDDVNRGHDCVGMFGQGRAKFVRSFNKEKGMVNTCTRLQVHLEHRITYETQMLEAQGGAGVTKVEIEVGGRIDGVLITKITKDRDGNINKIVCPGMSKYRSAHEAANVDMSRYTPPTADDIAELKARNDKRKAAKPSPIPIINVSVDDAAKLMAYWSEYQIEKLNREFSTGLEYTKTRVTQKLEKIKTHGPVSMTQASYSERSKGEGSPCRMVTISPSWDVVRYTYKGANAVEAFRIRIASPSDFDLVHPVVHIKDKPVKALPARVPVQSTQPETVELDVSHPVQV